MALTDVKVLIYAYRRGSEKHAICKAWLDSGVLGDAEFGVLSAVTLILTSPRAFSPSLTLEQGFALRDNLLGQPHCPILEPGNRDWGIFKNICLSARERGPTTSNAGFALLAIEHAFDGSHATAISRVFPTSTGARPERRATASRTSIFNPARIAAH